MSQEKANAIKLEFERITNLSATVSLMKSGDEHKPSALSKGWCGVYVLMNDECVFKVGKAGAKSQARWSSQHYNLHEKTPSTLPKSILKNKAEFKTYYPVEKHGEIDSLSKKNFPDWIKNNMSRIEFLIEDSNPYALGLLEALAQFHLKPLFEGKKPSAKSDQLANRSGWPISAST